MKNWTSSPPIVPIDKREEKLVPRFHFAFPLKSNFNENTAILRPVPSKFLYFSPPPIKINFSSSIDISSYPIGEYISSLEEGGQSGGGKAWNSWNFSTSIITSSTHCAWEFSNGVHRTIFSRCVGMYPFSKGKTRATNEYALSQERERDIYIYRTEKKDEIAVGDASVPRLILDLVKPPPLLNFALWLARRWWQITSSK